ncbi:MAG: S1C family serine protease, partial [Clostridia bacterium]|nr:S1C family serine protease [Clostridia bacterium]
MKKKNAIIIAVVMLLTAAIIGGIVMLTILGFNLFGRKPDSLFPYDAALSSGYTGTETDYLASQDTPSTRERKCYEDAVNSGAFSGTYLEFLQQFSSTGVDDSIAVNEAFTSVVCIESAFSGSYSRGSGIIYSLDKTAGTAYIITNYHVVCSSYGMARSISVYLYGEYGTNPISATFYGGVMDYDIAVLKVTNATAFKETDTNRVYAQAVTVADSDSVTVGERVYALGNPNGEGFSATGGVVSVLSEYVTVLRADERAQISLPEIRTDAAVNHGNSGGGLFNAEGELVGIVNARAEYADPDKKTIPLYGFGYAIPANLAVSIAQNVIDNDGRAVVARLGITVSVYDSKGIYDEERSKYYVQEKIVVESVTSGSAASGLRRTDTLLSARLVQGGKEKTVELTLRVMLHELLYEVRQGEVLE